MKEEKPFISAASLVTSLLFPMGGLSTIILSSKIVRYILVVILVLSLLTGIGLAAYGNLAVNDKQIQNYILNTATPLAFVPSGMIAGLFVMAYATNSTDFLTLKLEQLREDKEVITKKIETDKTLNIFNTIQLSLNQLDEYYIINKGQATYSFRASIFSIFIGLIAIVLGIWMNYQGSKHITLTFLAGVAGLLLEFIGGAYFFMYKKSLEQVNFFFGQLIKVQDTMLAINIADGIKEEAKKIEMQEKIIVSLLERSLK